MQILGKDLDLLGITYFKEHNLISVAPILYLRNQASAMSKYFNNLTTSNQIKMMYAILDKEEIHLHTLIKAMYK